MIRQLVMCDSCGHLRDLELSEKCFACGQVGYHTIPLERYELRQLIVQQEQKLASLYQRLADAHEQY